MLLLAGHLVLLDGHRPQWFLVGLLALLGGHGGYPRKFILELLEDGHDAPNGTNYLLLQLLL